MHEIELYGNAAKLGSLEAYTAIIEVVPQRETLLGAK